MTILKTGYFLKNIIIGSRSRGTCPPAREGLTHAAGGGTANQEHGDLVTQ